MRLGELNKGQRYHLTLNNGRNSVTTYTVEKQSRMFTFSTFISVLNHKREKATHPSTSGCVLA